MPKMGKTGCNTLKHPMQPIYLDTHGTARFKENAIVRYLFDLCTQKGIADLNTMAIMPFSIEDRMQFHQLIGYSVCGFGELHTSDREVVAKADKIAEGLH